MTSPDLTWFDIYHWYHAIVTYRYYRFCFPTWRFRSSFTNWAPLPAGFGQGMAQRHRPLLEVLRSEATKRRSDPANDKWLLKMLSIFNIFVDLAKSLLFIACQSMIALGLKTNTFEWFVVCWLILMLFSKLVKLGTVADPANESVRKFHRLQAGNTSKQWKASLHNTLTKMQIVCKIIFKNHMKSNSVLLSLSNGPHVTNKTTAIG